MNDPKGAGRGMDRELLGGGHYDPPQEGSRSILGPQLGLPDPGGVLERRMSEFTGVDGSLVPRSPDADDADVVEARTLLGTRARLTSWVIECLDESPDPAARINVVCALVWLGYKRWIDNQQDQANASWATARARLESLASFGKHEALARRLAELLRGFPE